MAAPIAVVKIWQSLSYSVILGVSAGVRERASMANLSSMNISMPAQMKGWVEEQAKSGRYSNASDYVRALIRHDQERAAKIENMQKLVDEARASGISTHTAEEIRTIARKQAKGDA